MSLIESSYFKSVHTSLAGFDRQTVNYLGKFAFGSEN